MKKSDFYYELPQELIAQTPTSDRSASRLLVLSKETGRITHRKFIHVIEYMRPGDVLVINDTRVIPARLMGFKENTGAKIELLLLKRKPDHCWETLVKPGKKAQCGTQIEFGDGLLKATVLQVLPDGNRLVQFHYEGIFEEILNQLGETPLPPYITEKLADRERYQTVYAQHNGSAAAPTAGLHFSNELLDQITAKGIEIARVTLHVGLGTFRPVQTEELESHHMHSEFYQITEEQAERINRCKKNGGHIIAVGTTSCRTLESNVNEQGEIRPGSGWTNIFIYPGYHFKAVDKLITNFHLPESTLLMLVSAFCNRNQILAAYEEAIREKYRFFSFGDAMMMI